MPKAKILDKDAENAMRLYDGLQNLIANMGNSLDKRQASNYVGKLELTSQGGLEELANMYRTNWVAAKVTDIPPEDMTREWRTFDGKDDPETIQMLQDEDERLDIAGNFAEALTWARLYGTGFIVMNVDDGEDMEKPLNMATIKEGGLRWLNVVSRREIQPDTAGATAIIDDPMDKDFGLPRHYRFTNVSADASQRIHKSRLIRFDGIKLPNYELRRQNYFSDSIIARLYSSIVNFDTATDSSASLLYSSNVDVFKIKGLMNFLQSAEGESKIMQRLQLSNLYKSITNSLILDSEEDIEKFTNSFASVPDLIDRFSQLLSAASDVPATRLLGVSASGFNATGEGDLKNYYDMIRSKQRKDFGPKLKYLDEIMAQSLRLSDSVDLSFSFNSLFQMTEKEQAEIENLRADRDGKYYDMQVINEVQIAKELAEKGTYTNITDEDIEELGDVNVSEDLGGSDGSEE